MDPVCGMKLDKKEAKFSKEIDGQKYYFCSQNCQDTFEKEPKKYSLKKNRKGGCCGVC